METEKCYTIFGIPYFVEAVCAHCGVANYIPIDAIDFDHYGFCEFPCDNCGAALILSEDDDEVYMLGEGVTE